MIEDDAHIRFKAIVQEGIELYGYFLACYGALLALSRAGARRLRPLS